MSLDVAHHRFELPECEDFEHFPYKTALSFKSLIDYWEQRYKAHGKDDVLAANTMKLLKDAPELYEPIRDYAIIDKRKQVIQTMMSAILPEALIDSMIVSANEPFEMHSFYASPPYDEIFQSYVKNPEMVDEKYVALNKFVAANAQILNKYYGMDVEIDAPLLFHITDPDTGMSKHYKMEINAEFMDVVCVKKMKKLTKKQLNSLVNNMHDIALWKELVPQDAFEFRGFIVHGLIDVTSQEVLSSIKNELLEKDSIISHDKINVLEDHMRSLFGLPEIKLGLIAFNRAPDQDVQTGRIWNSAFMEDSNQFTLENIEKSVYNEVRMTLKPVIIEDLRKLEEHSEIEKLILKKGFKNIVLAPLFYNQEPIGLLELGSPNPGDLNSMNLMVLNEVLPLFGIAGQRSTEEIKNKVQSVILEKYTAIHPTVQWRFTQAAQNFINNTDEQQGGEIEAIEFDHVYPLFGQSDIRNSSVARAKSIQADLIKQLELAQAVLAKANEFKDVPIYNELLYQVDQYVHRIKSGLNSGDEISVHEFIEQNLTRLFDYHYGRNNSFQREIKAYRDALDPVLGVIYDKRKKYEASVTRINEVIAAYLEEEQEKAQAKFPHYFEKYMTDGIEHNIYTGKSLMQQDLFGPMYLKNLRLWQLMITCEVARRTHQILPELEVPLETTHLILVYSVPLAIQFRADEKQFDVKGAYNMRYELVKKRIDKARVRGTNERITQPDKIAIIYTLQKEYDEYIKFVEFLQHQGLLKPEVEKLEVEELQGVEGLKALRVSVNTSTNNKALDKEIEDLIAHLGSEE